MKTLLILSMLALAACDTNTSTRDVEEANTACANRSGWAKVWGETVIDRTIHITCNDKTIITVRVRK